MNIFHGNEDFDDSALRLDLWTWLVAALHKVADTSSISARRYSVWERVDEHRQTLKDRFDLYVSPSILPELLGLPEWRVFETHLTTSPIAHKFNKLVKIPRSGLTLSAPFIASRFLDKQLRLDETASRIVATCDQSLFDNQFRGFVALLTASTARVVDSVYIARARLTGAPMPLALDNDLSVHNVADTDILEVLQNRFMIHPHFDLLGASDQCLLRIDRTFDVPISVGEVSVKASTEQAESDTKFDAAVKALALISADVVAIVSRQTVIQGEFSFFPTSFSFDPERIQVYPSQTIFIEAAAIQMSYPLALLMASEHSQFDLPLRSLLSSTTRKNPVDQLVDLVVACESIFIEQKSDSREIRNKISLRMGSLLRSTVDDRYAVFKTMRLAYDTRSSIVHGSKPSGNLPAQVAELRSLLRESLIRLGTLDAKRKPTEAMWTRMLFGEALSFDKR